MSRGLRLAAALAALTLLVGVSACKSTKPKATNRPPAVPVDGGDKPSGETTVPDSNLGKGDDVLKEEHTEDAAVPNAEAVQKRLKDAFFDFDSSDLRADAREALAASADALKANPAIRVTVEGHCDERGTREYNLSLGERRASSARDYLVSLGIAESRLTVISYGKEKPFNPGHDDSSWQENRRAHLVVTGRLMKRSLLGAVALLPLLATACVSTKDIDDIRKDINDVKRAVYSGGQKNLQEIGDLAGRIDSQSKQLLKSNADMGARIDELTGDLQSLQGKLEETNHRLQQLSQQIALTQRELQAIRGAVAAPPPAPSEPDLSMPPPPSAPSGVTSSDLSRGGSTTPRTSPPTSARPAPTGPASADPEELFRAAYADYTRGHYDLAIAGFREYIETYPKTESTGAARYWIGEAFFSQRKYRESIAEFDVVATRFPRSDKAPSALLKKGFAYIALGEKERGAAALQYVVREHPQSEEATAARQKLKSLGVDSR